MFTTKVVLDDRRMHPPNEVCDTLYSNSDFEMYETRKFTPGEFDWIRNRSERKAKFTSNFK